MGAWGPGLYSNDMAEDLLPVLRAVLRVPLALDEVLAMAADSALQDADPLERLTFDLVVADQLEKSGLRHPARFARAVQILDSGADLAVLKDHGMTPADLKRRAAQNEKLAGRLRNPRPEKSRKVMRRPGAIGAAKGDFLAFPTQLGRPHNPYQAPGAVPFQPDGWGLIQVLDVGHAFGWLPWVAIEPLDYAGSMAPRAAQALAAGRTDKARFGTLSPSHFARMGCVCVANATPPVILSPPDRINAHATAMAVSDISIYNVIGREM